MRKLATLLVVLLSLVQATLGCDLALASSMADSAGAMKCCVEHCKSTDSVQRGKCCNLTPRPVQNEVAPSVTTRLLPASIHAFVVAARFAQTVGAGAITITRTDSPPESLSLARLCSRQI